MYKIWYHALFVSDFPEFAKMNFDHFVKNLSGMWEQLKNHQVC